MPQYPIPTHQWVTAIEVPLYGQVLPAEATDDDLAAMLADIERITMAIGSPIGWVTDVSNILKATPKQRKMYADSDHRLQQWDKRWCSGTAVICTGALTRGIVTAVHWMTPPVYPFRIFASRREGERWARQQLIARGVDISPDPQSIVSQIERQRAAP